MVDLKWWNASQASQLSSPLTHKKQGGEPIEVFWRALARKILVPIWMLCPTRQLPAVERTMHSCGHKKIQCTEKGVCSLEDLFGGTGSIYLRAYTSCMQVFVIRRRKNSLTSSPSPSCLQQTVECIVWDAHSSNKSLLKFQWPMPCRKHQFQFELCCWAALGLG